MSKTKTITRLRKHRGEMGCAYCGHVTPALHGGVTDKMEVARHILTCDKRPERSLCRRIERLEAALKYCATTLEIASSGVTEVDECIATVREVLAADWKAE